MACVWLRLVLRLRRECIQSSGPSLFFFDTDMGFVLGGVALLLRRARLMPDCPMGFRFANMYGPSRTVWNKLSLQGRFKRKLETYFLEKSDFAVFATEAVQTEFRQNVARVGPCFVISNPVPPDHVAQGARAVTKNSGDGWHFVAIGSLSERKNLQMLFEALLLLSRAGRLFILDVVGEGPLEAQLRDFVARAGLEQIIHFHGYCRDTIDLVQRADLLLHPASSEGFGFAVLEAISLGTPVIAYQGSGGAAEVVVATGGGYCFDRLVAESIATTIEHAIGNPELNAMGRAAAQSARRLFGPEAVARAYDDVWESAVRQPVNTRD